MKRNRLIGKYIKEVFNDPPSHQILLEKLLYEHLSGLDDRELVKEFAKQVFDSN